MLYSRSLLVIYFIFPVKLRKAKNKFSKKENIKDIKENKNKQGKREILKIQKNLKLAENIYFPLSVVNLSIPKIFSYF